MSEATRAEMKEIDIFDLVGDPALERIQRDRKPGEIESGMMSGSDDAEISATERFEGDLTPEQALRVLDPEHHGPSEETEELEEAVDRSWTVW